MDLIQLVPQEPLQTLNQLIVHTKYNCIAPQKADEIKSTVKQDGITSRIRHWILQNCILSRTHPYTQIYLKSDTIITYEIVKHITFYPKMIHPTSNLRYFWDWFQVIFTLIALIVIPILNSFYLEFHRTWMYVMLFINLIFVFDMILCFFTGYIEKDTRNVILDSKLVTSNYLKGFFVVDLVSSFPMEIIDLFTHDQGLTASLYCSVFNAFTFFRIKNVLTYAKNIQYTHRFSLKTYKVFEVAVIIILSVHWAACMEYYMPVIIKYLALSEDYEQASWIYSESMEKRDSVLKKYILCLNRAVISFVCSTHFLDVIAWEDVILNLIFSFIGKGGFIYLLVQMMHLMTTYNTQHEHARQNQQLKEYAKYKQLPNDIQKQLHIYSNYTSKKYFGSNKSIFYDIPPKLQEVIILLNKFE